MIKLDAARQASLEAMFDFADDRDLIQELLRRGRLRQLESATYFWPEMREESGYMDSVKDRTFSALGRALADDRDAAPVIEEMYPISSRAHVHGQGVYHASIIVVAKKER
jgi:hypothetical protein